MCAILSHSIYGNIAMQEQITKQRKKKGVPNVWELTWYSQQGLDVALND